MKHRHAFSRAALTVLLAFVGVNGHGTEPHALHPSADAGRPNPVARDESMKALHALLPNVESFALETGAQGPRYRVWLYRPDTASGSHAQPRVEGESADPKPQDAAAPLLVLLDGNATFALAVSAARLQERVIGPVVIAAIAADNDELFDEHRRFRDFATPNRDGWGVPRNAAGEPIETGGTQAFAVVVNVKLLRAIEARVEVAPAQRMLFGHSLGGFFVLQDALAHPGASSRYMAASPSLWWNAGEMPGRIRAGVQTARGNAADTVIPLAIRVGGSEQQLAPNASPARLERVTHAAMLDNARSFATLLNDTPSFGFVADLKIYPGGNHVSYLPAAISEAVMLASGRG